MSTHILHYTTHALTGWSQVMIFSHAHYALQLTRTCYTTDYTRTRTHTCTQLYTALQTMQARGMHTLTHRHTLYTTDYTHIHTLTYTHAHTNTQARTH